MTNFSKTNAVDEIRAMITKLPSRHYGLLWTPTMGDDNVDMVNPPALGSSNMPPQHFSELDQFATIDALNKIPKTPRLIVEIGVYGDTSTLMDGVSTKTILGWKPKDCTYIGIDVRDVSHINDASNNIYTLRNDSAEHHKLYAAMAQLNLTEIDFMFVDGFHSIKQVLLDWQYWERMAPKGVMAFHDINYQPGPVAILDAIDPEIFDVFYYGRETPDWGVAVVAKK